VPESSGFQSNAASSSLFLHVELGIRTALVQLIAHESTVHGFFQRLGYYRRQPQTLAVVQLHRSLHCGVKPIYSYMYTHHQTVAIMVSYYVTFLVTVYGEFFGKPNSSPHEMSGGFISLHAKPH